MIDPDGPGQGVAPFKVYCDFEKGEQFDEFAF